MSSEPDEKRTSLRASAGLSAADAASLGPLGTAQVRAFRLILVIAQQLRHQTDALYRADGLTTQQATLLSFARSLGKPALSELAARMFTSHQNTKQLVSSLVRKGFVKLVADSEDARIKRVLTTPKNERYWAARDPADFGHVARWFSGLSPAETKQLLALLVKLDRSLQQTAEMDEPST